jgi:uncharacterized repeat protein (TIGR01451 family)
MHARRSRFAPLMAVSALAAVFLVLPSSALANHVAADSSASCDVVAGTPTITLNVVFQAFTDANKPVTGTISIDGTVVQTYDGATAFTFTGTDSTLTYTQATTPGSHTITGSFTWPGKTDADNGDVAKEVTCPAPPPTIGITVDKNAVESTAVAGSTVHFTVDVTNTGNTAFVEYSFSDPKCPGATRTGTNADDPSFDPGDVWHYACAMATQVGQTSADNTATATGKNAQGMTATAEDSASIPLTAPTGTTPGTTPPAVVPPPGGGVLPEETAAGLARLLGPSGCVKQAFRARVTGRSIASVAFFVDGKLVKRIVGVHDVYSVRLHPRALGLGRHRVVARVRFVSASGTAPQRFRLTFRRCAAQQVAPRFTG